MRLQFLLSEVAGGLKRNVSMIVSVILVSMVSMFFLGAGLLAQKQVDVAKGYWYDKVQVSVFLCTSQSGDVPSCADGKVTDAQRSQIRSDLLSLKPLVQEVHHESATEAYKRFKEQFKNSPELASVDANAIPESFRVKLSDPSRVGEIIAALDGAPGVEAVSDQRKALDTFFRLLNVISIGSVLLAGLMTVCAVLLITTTIQQVARTRKREVEIMRSVGASATVVRLPFLVETVLAVLIGAGLAVGALWAMVHYGTAQLLEDGTGGPVSLIGTGDVWSIAPWLGIGGFIVAVATAWLALRRHLRV